MGAQAQAHRKVSTLHLSQAANQTPGELWMKHSTGLKNPYHRSLEIGVVYHGKCLDLDAMGHKDPDYVHAGRCRHERCAIKGLLQDAGGE